MTSKVRADYTHPTHIGYCHFCGQRVPGNTGFQCDLPKQGGGIFYVTVCDRHRDHLAYRIVEAIGPAVKGTR